MEPTRTRRGAFRYVSALPDRLEGLLEATHASWISFIAGLGTSAGKAAMRLSALNCCADNDFHYGLAGVIGHAASSPRLYREAFPAGHLTPLIGLRDRLYLWPSRARSRSGLCSIARSVQIWKARRVNQEDVAKSSGAIKDRFDAWPWRCCAPLIVKGVGAGV
jgi:hypothetical protein